VLDGENVERKKVVSFKVVGLLFILAEDAAVSEGVRSGCTIAPKTLLLLGKSTKLRAAEIPKRRRKIQILDRILKRVG
jgi:hypothetical protein